MEVDLAKCKWSRKCTYGNGNAIKKLKKVNTEIRI